MIEHIQGRLPDPEADDQGFVYNAWEPMEGEEGPWLLDPKADRYEMTLYQYQYMSIGVEGRVFFEDPEVIRGKLDTELKHLFLDMAKDMERRAATLRAAAARIAS